MREKRTLVKVVGRTCCRSFLRSWSCARQLAETEIPCSQGLHGPSRPVVLGLPCRTGEKEDGRARSHPAWSTWAEIQPAGSAHSGGRTRVRLSVGPYSHVTPLLVIVLFSVTRTNHFGYPPDEQEAAGPNPESRDEAGFEQPSLKKPKRAPRPKLTGEIYVIYLKIDC